MIALSVNLNKIALIRNSRDTTNPNIPQHAQMCIDAGANGITVHPRPDQRHIRVTDCFDLASMLHDRSDVEDYPGFMALVKEIRPTQCTLVPDGDGQLTSDHGFDLKQDGEQVARLVQELQSLGIRTSLFMDPDPQQIRLAAQTGTDRVELYTETYARAFRTGDDLEHVFQQFVRAAEVAVDEGLGLNAGHDLDLNNLPRFATIAGLREVSIGHHLTVDAIRMGLADAVAAYQRALGTG